MRSAGGAPAGKEARAAVLPGVSKQPRSAIDPDRYLRETIVWRLGAFDYESRWGIAALAGSDWRKHLAKHVRHLETMKWGEIMDAAGGKGRGRGTNSHPIPSDRLCRAARRRLDELEIHSDEVFSLRLEGKVRVFGIRDGNVLNVLWFDPDHEICPAARR